MPQTRSLFNQQELAGKRQEVQQGRTEFNKATARSWEESSGTERKPKVQRSTASTQDQSSSALGEGKPPQLGGHSSRHLGLQATRAGLSHRAVLSPHSTSLFSPAKSLGSPAKRPCAVLPSEQGPEPAASTSRAQQLPSTG